MKTMPSTRRWWRIGAIVLACLALLFGAAWLALVKAFPPQRLAALVSEQVKAATGRDFSIQGELAFQLLPSIAVVASEVTLGNADWGSRPAMVRIQRAAFAVALWPLLDGQIRILGIDVQGSDVLLETDGHGRANWQFSDGGAKPVAPASAASGAASVPDIALDRLLLADARIGYRDGATGTTQTLVVESLDLQQLGDRNPLVARISLAGQRWQIEGEIGPLQALAAGRDDWPFGLRLTGAGAKASAKGQLGGGKRAGQVQAALTARLDSAAALAPLGAGATALPLPMELSATLLRTADALRADTIRLSLAGQRVEGRLALLGGAQQRLEGQLSAGEIDVGALMSARPGAGVAASAAAPAPGPAKQPFFGDQALALPTLPALPITLDLRVDTLRVPGLPVLSALALQLHSGPGRLRLAPLSLVVAQGQLQGELDLTLPADGLPHWGLSVDAQGLSLPALAALAGRGGELRSGHLDLHARLALSGNTPRALAASADGQVLLRASGAAVVGGAAIQTNFLQALLETLIPHRGADKPLEIQCAVLRLPLRQGVAAIDRSIALETERMAVAASGELNLAAQTLALSFRQTTKKGVGLNAATLAQLVTVRGPLHDPKLGVDVKGSAREAATLGAAVATGGLSLLAGGAHERADGARVCDYAASGAPAPAGPSARKPR